MQVCRDVNQLPFVLQDKHLWSLNTGNDFRSLINLITLSCIFKITPELQPSELGLILIAVAYDIEIE